LTIIRDILQQFFDADGWAYTEVEPNVLRVRFGDKTHQEWWCFARVREQFGQLVFYSQAPLLIAEDRRASAAVLINQANFGLQVGNFEMDIETGALQYRTSIDVEGEEDRLTPLMVKHLVYANVLTMERYLPAFESFENGLESPEIALALVE
jgi:hypothetical protein